MVNLAAVLLYMTIYAWGGWMGAGGLDSAYLTLRYTEAGKLFGYKDIVRSNLLFEKYY